MRHSILCAAAMVGLVASTSARAATTLQSYDPAAVKKGGYRMYQSVDGNSPMPLINTDPNFYGLVGKVVGKVTMNVSGPLDNEQRVVLHTWDSYESVLTRPSQGQHQFVVPLTDALVTPGLVDDTWNVMVDATKFAIPIVTSAHRAPFTLGFTLTGGQNRSAADVTLNTVQGITYVPPNAFVFTDMYHSDLYERTVPSPVPSEFAVQIEAIDSPVPEPSVVAAGGACVLLAGCRRTRR